MYGYIYRTTNNINNQKYIGMHKASEFDKDYYGSGIIISKALEKYGYKNFSVEILEWCETKEKMCESEKKWIAKFDATNSDEYYNIHHGGQGGLGDITKNYNAEQLEEFRQHVKEGISKLSPKQQELRYKHMRDAWTPEKRKEFAKQQASKWTDELKKEMSDKQKKIWSDPDLLKRHSNLTKDGLMRNTTSEQRVAIATKASLAAKAKIDNMSPTEREALRKKKQDVWTPEKRRLHSERTKAAWTPERTAKMLESRKRNKLLREQGLL